MTNGGGGGGGRGGLFNTLSLSIPGVYRKMLQKMKVQEFVSVIYLQVVRPIS